MNIFLWIIQMALALHTTMGAVWKFSHTPEQTMPSLKAIPQGVWIGIAIFELLCALVLVLPVIYKPSASLAPWAPVGIGAIMIVYCGLHLFSGATNFGPMIYWLVVAAVCAFLAYGRFALKPL